MEKRRKGAGARILYNLSLRSRLKNGYCCIEPAGYEKGRDKMREREREKKL